MKAWRNRTGAPSTVTTRVFTTIPANCSTTVEGLHAHRVAKHDHNQANKQKDEAEYTRPRTDQTHEEQESNKHDELQGNIDCIGDRP